MKARRSSSLLFLPVVLALPASASAQEVIRGRVVDDSDLTPILGAVVSLIDVDGERLRSVFVGDDGTFVLRMPDARAVALRAEMIGRRSVDLLLDPSSRQASLTLRLPAEPIQLEGIDVSVGKRCELDPSTAETTYVVWHSALPPSPQTRLSTASRSSCIRE
jgi:hypothetical protein